MRSKTSSLLFLIFSIVPSVLVGYTVYRYTDHLFRVQKFPYPFELFGWAAGLGAACWTYAIVSLFRRIARRLRRPSSSPYAVEEKIKINASEVLK